MKAIYLILTLLLVVGCQQGETVTTTNPFVGGTTGLKIDFVESAPPAEAYDKGTYPFDIAVQIENIGEHTVSKDDVLVTISGIDPADFGKSLSDMSAHPTDDLRKTYKNSENKIIEGTVASVEFTGFNYQGELTGNTQFPIRANVCYKYGTTANSILCYRKDILDTTHDDNHLCTINEDKAVYNSGAPVVVDNLQETARGTNKIAFNFEIKHKGTGDIFERGTTCDSSSREFEDIVYVTVDTGFDSGLECSSLSDGSQGSVKLYGGHKIVSCTQEVTDSSDFKKPVVITLEYDYEEDKTTDITVKHTTN